MKKRLLGIGIFICGVIALCTDYAVDAILGAMPGVTLVPGGISITAAALVLMLLGAVLAVIGLTEK